MPDNSESSRPVQTSRRRGRRLRFWLALLALFALVCIAFEVGIRHVPPDGMTVTLVRSPGGYFLDGPPLIYTAPKDQHIIDAYYTSLNAAPVEASRASANYALFHGCYPNDYPQITFTRHGIPVESWISQDSASICEYVENSGGLSENLTGTFHVWMPVQAVPLPASQ
jgi:hypothetical protein